MLLKYGILTDVRTSTNIKRLLEQNKILYDFENLLNVQQYKTGALSNKTTYLNVKTNVISKISYIFNYNGAQLQCTITFDDGLYSINNINFTISRFTEISRNGNDASLIQFYAESTNKLLISHKEYNDKSNK